MKNLIFAITLILCCNSYAQEKFDKEVIFVRVYDLQGKKISKGKIISVTDSLLQVNRNGERVKIAMNSIGKIKTKRSAGNNVLMGAATGATALAIILAAAANSPDDCTTCFTASDGVTAGVFYGGIAGAAIGGITILFKNSKTFEINGDELKWKKFKEMITGLNQWHTDY